MTRSVPPLRIPGGESVIVTECLAQGPSQVTGQFRSRFHSVALLFFFIFFSRGIQVRSNPGNVSYSDCPLREDRSLGILQPESHFPAHSESEKISQSLVVPSDSQDCVPSLAAA